MSFLINPYLFGNTFVHTTFDGVNESIYCGTDSSISFERTNAFSISAWIYASSAGSGTYRGIVGKDNQGSGGLNRGYFISTTNIDKIQFQIRNNGSNRLRGESTNTITTDAWNHIAFSYDGSSNISGCKLYINGSLETFSVSENTLSATILNSSQFCIANSTSIGSSDFFNGKLDKVNIYNRQLSSTEVSQLYNSTKFKFGY